MRCDKCKFWQYPTEAWETIQAGIGVCGGVRERWDIADEASGNRHNNDFTKVRCDALRAARAFVEDGSEYHAALVTAPDFFCALFAEKAA